MDNLFSGVPEATYKKFLNYHSENPQVWKAFERRAMEIKAAGRNRYSAKTIMELIRWEYDVNAANTECFKINNNYTALYARIFMQKHTHMRGFFEIREENLFREAA